MQSCEVPSFFYTSMIVLEILHTYLGFLQVSKIEDNGKMKFQKEFILTPYKLFA
jgi:hypothetical protein